MPQTHRLPRSGPAATPRRQLRNQFFVFAALALTPLAFPREARATEILYDNFNQSAGTNLGGTTPSSPNPGTSGTNQQWSPESGVPDNQFVSPGLSFPGAYTNGPPVGGGAIGLSGSIAGGQNVDRIVINSSGANYGPAGNLTTAYYSLLLSVPANLTGILPHSSQSTSNTGNNNAMVAALSDSSGLTGSLGTAISGIYLSAGATAGTFDIGIGGGQSQGVTWSSDLTPGQTYFLVASFVKGSPDTSSLWIDPALGLSSAPSPDLSQMGSNPGGFGDGDVAVLALTSNTGLPNSGLVADEVRVGTTWQDVTPATVPEPSSWALFALGALGMFVLVGRRVN